MLSQIVEQIKDEIKVTPDGKGFASIRATARLSGVSDMALRANFGCEDNLSKMAEKLTSQGFQVRTFSESGVPDLAVALIVEYYAFDAGKRCTEQAKLVYRAFAGCGVRAWMHDLTGWQKPAQTPTEALLVMVQQMVALEHQQREQQQAIALIAKKQQAQNERIEAVEHEQDRFNSPCGHKYTVLGYAKKVGVEISRNKSSQLGRKSATMCRSMGIDIEYVDDPRFGEVGLYPQSILAQVFSGEM
jgi:hypothetical protein